MMHQLVHHRAVPQADHVFFEALHTSRRDLSDLARVEPWKARPHIYAVVLFHEACARFHSTEVDEAIANVAPLLEVDGEVYKIKLATEIRVELFHQHLARVLVGDVPQHYGREGCGAFGATSTISTGSAVASAIDRATIHAGAATLAIAGALASHAAAGSRAVATAAACASCAALAAATTPAAGSPLLPEIAILRPAAGPLEIAGSPIQGAVSGFGHLALRLLHQLALLVPRVDCDGLPIRVADLILSRIYGSESHRHGSTKILGLPGSAFPGLLALEEPVRGPATLLERLLLHHLLHGAIRAYDLAALRELATWAHANAQILHADPGSCGTAISGHFSSLWATPALLCLRLRRHQRLLEPVALHGRHAALEGHVHEHSRTGHVILVVPTGRRTRANAWVQAHAHVANVIPTWHAPPHATVHVSV
mmetsp:Transcript_116058/g.248198  ORF Transcript_116058/g.248198 Transcript_116058/m.248198 type:complete len:425 (+) Transcript_116058:325-1599(+)